MMSTPNHTADVGARVMRHGALALGCWVFGGADWGGQRDEDSLAAMAAARDAGITHWDTALAYGSGRSEMLCGEFLRGNRDPVFLATKGVPGEHPDSILKSLETSLKNLRTDRIDLYYLHWPRRDVDLRPHMERLEIARQRGIIGGIGVSNFSPEQMDRIGEVGTVDVHQLCYSLLWRRREADVIPYCRRRGITTIAYSPLAQGILGGAFARDHAFRDGDNRAATVFFQSDTWPRIHDAVEMFARVARALGRPLANVALAWIRARGHIDVVAAGARNARQVTENVAAIAQPLPDQAEAALTDISDRLQPQLPNEDNIFKYYP